jgi:hypothetical protein
MSKDRDRDYGIDPLDKEANPAERLHQEILSRLGERHPSWQVGAGFVSAAELAEKTRLARGTVTSTLQRLVTEGVLEPQRGRGYRILGETTHPRATTVVSVTEFCQQEKLECVSVLDHESCCVLPLADHLRAEPSYGEEMRKAVTGRLNIGGDEPMLLIRRARAFRRKGSNEPLRWAILETLFLIEKRLPFLQSSIQGALQPAGTPQPLGNLSLHRWMTSQGIDLERSEYSLTLAALVGRDASVWESALPRPHHRATEHFLRLRAVTYGKRLGPLLFTQEHLVPDMFDLAVTGFRFRLGTQMAQLAER